MEQAQNKIIDVIKNNQKWPLILQGVNILNLKSMVCLDAKSQDISILIDENGKTIYPAFVKEIIQKQKNKRVILCLNNLDLISKDKQVCFLNIIKNKQIIGYKFPDNVQIIIPVKNVEKICIEISSLCLIYKAV